MNNSIHLRSENYNPLDNEISAYHSFITVRSQMVDSELLELPEMISSAEGDITDHWMGRKQNLT